LCGRLIRSDRALRVDSLDYLLLFNYHPDFLAELYRRNPSLAGMPFEAQTRRVLEAALCVGGSYAHYLVEMGCRARVLIVNADELQQRWAVEHDVVLSGDVHERRRRIVAAQVDWYRPDVLYVFEWCPLAESFLEEMRSKVRCVAGQIASPLHPKRRYHYCDVMFSSIPGLVEYFRSVGLASEVLGLGFDPRVLEALGAGGECREWKKDLDVTFVGGFAPSHPGRAGFLEEVAREVPVRVFGYGAEGLGQDSPLRGLHGGEVWAREMFSVLRRSKITLNHHARIEVPGRGVSRWANNMRLFEATGVGTMLLTDERDGLVELFEPGVEVAVYRDAAECAAKVRRYLADDAARARMAAAGQARTLRDHCYSDRVGLMHEVVSGWLRRNGASRRVRSSS